MQKVDTAIEYVIKEGWPTSKERLIACFGAEITNYNVTKLTDCLIKGDLRKFGVSVLFNQISRKPSEFQGPLILQLVKIIDISMPKSFALTNDNGLYKLHLTDGCSAIQAVTFESVPRLNCKTPVGSKLHLLGIIRFEFGLLLLTSTNCRLISGDTFAASSNKIGFKGFTNVYQPSDSVTKAPKWIPFLDQKTSLAKNRHKNDIRANDVINNQNKPVSAENAHFYAARQAQIEEAIEYPMKRRFDEIQVKMKEMEIVEKPGHSYWKTICKASKLSSGSKNARDENRNSLKSNKHIESDESDESCNSWPSNDSPVGRGRVNDWKIHRSWKMEESAAKNCSNSVRVNSKNFKDHYEHMKDCLENDREDHHEDTKDHENIKDYHKNITDRHNNGNNNSQLKIDGLLQNKEPKKISVTWKAGKSHFPKKWNSVSHSKAILEKQPSVRSGSLYKSDAGHFNYIDNRDAEVVSSKLTWKIGDKCMAPWIDGKYYFSTIVSMGPADMCSLTYDNYGNLSVVPLGVLLPC